MDLKFTVLILSAVCQATFGDSDGKIVGGQIIDIASIPYFVSVEYKGGHLCGGSIINESWILSAAHCFNGDAPNYTVRSGTSRKARNGKVHVVEQIYAHPNYSTSYLDNDFLLLKLAEPIELDEKRQVIELADPYMYYTGAEVLTSGFGETENPMESSSFLRGVIVSISDSEICSTAYTDMITPNMFCAGAKDRDSCQGKRTFKGKVVQVNSLQLLKN